MNKWWKNCAKVSGNVDGLAGLGASAWESRSFTEVLDRICDGFCTGILLNSSLLVRGFESFAHRTTITATIYNKGR